jgi:hypothetical protein
MSWGTVSEKFVRLAEPFTDAALRNDIIGAVQTLETLPADDLFSLLAEVEASDA